jgi:hypothetical protein
VHFTCHHDPHPVANWIGEVPPAKLWINFRANRHIRTCWSYIHSLSIDIRSQKLQSLEKWKRKIWLYVESSNGQILVWPQKLHQSFRSPTRYRSQPTQWVHWRDPLLIDDMG